MAIHRSLRYACVIAAWLATGLPATAFPAQSRPSEHPLLSVSAVSDDISQVVVTDDQGNLQVHIDGQGIPAGVVPPANWKPGIPLEKLNLQVWILRRDGRAAKAAGKPGLSGRGNGGWKVASMVFSFERTARRDLAGVVVSSGGTLYAWPLSTK